MVTLTRETVTQSTDQRHAAPALLFPSVDLPRPRSRAVSDHASTFTDSKMHSALPDELSAELPLPPL